MSLEWISVKDRLPEMDANILYVLKNRGCMAFVRQGMRCFDGNQWWWCDVNGVYDEDGNEPGFSAVTYWMPMPDLPKEQP